MPMIAEITFGALVWGWVQARDPTHLSAEGKALCDLRAIIQGPVLRRSWALCPDPAPSSRGVLGAGVPGHPVGRAGLGASRVHSTAWVPWLHRAELLFHCWHQACRFFPPNNACFSAFLFPQAVLKQWGSFFSI